MAWTHHHWVRGTLLKFSEILHGTKASFGEMDLLLEHAAETDCVKPKASLLWTDIGESGQLSWPQAVHDYERHTTPSR
jgi:hypothetical protein